MTSIYIRFAAAIMAFYGVAQGQNLFVSNGNQKNVLEYNGSSGAFITAFVPTGSGGLGNAQGLTFGPDGNLYVSHYDNSRVLKYNGSTGAFISVFVSPGSGSLSGS